MSKSTIVLVCFSLTAQEKSICSNTQRHRDRNKGIQRKLKYLRSLYVSDRAAEGSSERERERERESTGLDRIMQDSDSEVFLLM